MFEKRQQLYIATENGTVEEMCRSILSQIAEDNLLKIVFFNSPACDAEYLQNYDTFHATVKKHFTHNTPLVSYVAQEPTGYLLAAEVTTLADNCATAERHEHHILLKSNNCTEIIIGGIIPKDITRSTFEQSTDIFVKIRDILQSNGFEANHIYRQWNYIQGITSMNDGSQNYQEFNDARSIFYSRCEWSNGYPAATGIGTIAGGVMVELNAIREAEITNKAIDNPLQIAAHSYSQEVLDGKTIESLTEKTTPKFERARILGNTIYISGTAAIKGEQSNPSNDAAVQTAETMKIMDRLVAKDNIPVSNNGSQYDLLRIYVKNINSIGSIKAYMEAHYPTVDKLYLIADICRPELLVEIEGIAHI